MYSMYKMMLLTGSRALTPECAMVGTQCRLWIRRKRKPDESALSRLLSADVAETVVDGVLLLIAVLMLLLLLLPLLRNFK